MNAACGYMVGGPPVGGPGGVPYHESDDQSRLRFQVELEFVQCLANPNYLNFLAQRGYLKEKEFVNYLKYLLYWKNPEYAAYLKYPQCLHLLELLQYEGFRTEIINTPCAKFIEDQLLLHWQHYPRKRLKLLEQHAAADASSPAASAGGNHPSNVLPPPSSSSTAPTPSPSIDTAPNSALTAGGGPSSVGGGGQSGPSTPHSNAGPPKS